MFLFLPTTFPPKVRRKRSPGDDLPKQPRRRIELQLACNDHRNGFFIGQFESAQISVHRLESGKWITPLDDPQAELQLSEGCPIGLRLDLPAEKIKISRREFKYLGWNEWVGNWCWNSYYFDFATGLDVLSYLRDSGKLGCECAETSFYRWWNRETEELPECLR